MSSISKLKVNNDTYKFNVKSNYPLTVREVRADEYKWYDGYITYDIQKNKLYERTIILTANVSNAAKLWLSFTVLSEAVPATTVSFNDAWMYLITYIGAKIGYSSATAFVSGYYQPNTTVGFTPISRVIIYSPDFVSHPNGYIRIYYNSGRTSSTTYIDIDDTELGSSTISSWNVNSTYKYSGPAHL